MEHIHHTTFQGSGTIMKESVERLWNQRTGRNRRKRVFWTQQDHTLMNSQQLRLSAQGQTTQHSGMEWEGVQRFVRPRL